MYRAYERCSFRQPQAIFDLVDSYSRQLLGGQAHPRPAEPIRFRLVRRIAGGATRTYEPPLELRVRRNSSGYHVFFGQVVQADKTVLDLQPAGETYVIRIEGAVFQPVERSIILPSAQLVQTIDMLPGYAYPFPSARLGGPALLRGCLRTQDETPIVGGVVKVVGQPISCVTDRTGQWVLALPATLTDRDITVRIQHPDGAARDQTVWIEPGSEVALKPTALYGTLCEPDGTGVPNATVSVDGQALAARTDATGRWWLSFPDDQPTAKVGVRFARPGEPARAIRAPVLAGHATEVQQPTLRGLVLGAGGAGLAGATITVDPFPDSATTDIGGRWFYYLAIDQPETSVTVTAAGPGAQTQRRKDVPVQPDGTVVVPTFRFD